MAKRFNYGKMRNTASRLLERFKQGSVQVHRVVPSEPPPDWPEWEIWEGEPTTQVYELDAVVKGVSEKFIDGDTIRATDLEVTCSDKMVLVSVNGEAVAPADEAFDVSLAETMTIDGKPVTVLQKITVPAAGVSIVHRFIVRA